jgi:hypothetical protein
MRSFVLISCFIAIFLIIIVTTLGIALAAIAPFLPGDILFPLQDFTEQKVVVIYSSPESKSMFTLDLFEPGSRIRIPGGTEHELIALQKLQIGHWIRQSLQS